MHSDTDDTAPRAVSYGSRGGDAKSEAESAPALDAINDAIGLALKAHYRSLTEAPLPDRFLVLLAELEAIDADHHE